MRPKEVLYLPLGVVATNEFHRFLGYDIHRAPSYFVCLNGLYIGLSKSPGPLVAMLRRLRRAGRLDSFISISTNHSHRTVYISSDGGRLCR